MGLPDKAQMIPFYVIELTEKLGINDIEAEKAYNAMVELKFLSLEKSQHKAFFLAVIALLGVKHALSICEWISSKYRIPRLEITKYKHEYCLHYLNSLDTDKADKLLLLALIDTVEDIKKIKTISKTLRVKAKKQADSRPKIIGYL